MRSTLLKWDINSLKQGDNHFNLSIKAESVGLNKKVIEENIEGEINLKKKGNKIELEGTLLFALTLECARCFETFQINKKEEMHTFFLKMIEHSQREKIKLSTTDNSVEYTEDGMIDIAPLVYDAVSLLIPMKPLCNLDCKGLCPVCGTNLNREHCECRNEKVDPRWEPLKKLLR